MIGFDDAAERYDDDERGNPVLAHMRERVHEQLAVAFGTGSKLIELGSGTGTDAVRLAQRGCHVALVDVAPRLLERAASKVRAARSDAVLGAHLLRASEVGTLCATYGRGAFDGAYSSFGPLNCEPTLHPVAEALAELVRPGGRVVLSLINRWCPAEVGWFLMHGDIGEATRRWRGPVSAAAYPGGPKDITTWYYSRRDVERAFAPAFDIEHTEALPLLWPPPYLDFLVTRFSRTFRALAPLERWAAPRPVLRDLGDHVLLRLRRG